MKLPPSRGASAPDGAHTRPEKKPAELRRQERFLKEGRGQGTGANYKPFILVEKSGFQSRGRSHIIYNHELNRQHHLLSDLELLVFLWAWSFQANDYREQFPLQRFELDPQFLFLPRRARGTIEIASSMGLRHPIITKKAPRIMTTDLLVTFADSSHVAVHTKYLKDQVDASTRKQELKAIENQYWRDRHVKFISVDETRFTEGRANQMLWSIDGMRWCGGEKILYQLVNQLSRTSQREPMDERLYATSRATGLAYGEAVLGFKFAMLARKWSVDLDTELTLSLPWPGRALRVGPVISASGFRGAYA